MSELPIKGSCLCGAVTYQFMGPLKVFQYCHCSRCRKFTGSAYASNIIIDPDQFEWLQGQEHLGRYEITEARHFATAYCLCCGSSMPWLTQSKRAIVIPAGTLDDELDDKPVHNIYYQDRASWYVDASELKHYDALPIK